MQMWRWCPLSWSYGPDWARLGFSYLTLRREFPLPLFVATIWPTYNSIDYIRDIEYITSRGFLGEARPNRQPGWLICLCVTLWHFLSLVRRDLPAIDVED